MLRRRKELLRKPREEWRRLGVEDSPALLRQPLAQIVFIPLGRSLVRKFRTSAASAAFEHEIVDVERRAFALKNAHRFFPPFFQRAAAPFFPISESFLRGAFFARAFPPSRPSATAAGFF